MAIESSEPGGQPNPAETHQSPEVKTISLDGFSPAEIVAAYREARSRGLRGRINNALSDMTERDPDRAREVHLAFVDSPLPEDRMGAVYGLIEVTNMDREFGVALWDRLLRDSDPKVRSEARYVLSDFEDALDRSDSEECDRVAAMLGMTWDDGHNLVAAAERAEQGRDIFDLGQNVVQRMLEKDQSGPGHAEGP